MITDAKIIKDGKEIDKVSLMYISGDPCLCDGCDEFKKCARVNLICRDDTVICKDCLQEMVNCFEN